MTPRLYRCTYCPFANHDVEVVYLHLFTCASRPA